MNTGSTTPTPTTDAQIKSLVTAGIPAMHKVEKNLYIRVTKPGTGFWVYQYKLQSKPHRMTLGRYGRRPDGMPLADAREELVKVRALSRQGINPLAEKKRSRLLTETTVDDIAADWLDSVRRSISNHHIPERVYRKEISPLIGKIAINRVSGLDIRHVLKTVQATNRPTTANDTLTHLKQLFGHAVKLGVIVSNPALAFNNRDAGGTERSRTRALSIDEIRIFFEVARNHSKNFTRENYLAVAILLVLMVRKTELTAAKWEEFDLDTRVWLLPAERAKNKYEIAIPLPTQVINWLNELKIRSAGSEYIFPSRRASGRPYISDDTINAALANLFGKSTRPTGSTTGDVLGAAGLSHFVIHDLRRSGRTILPSLGYHSDVSEKCLNHKPRGVVGTYDRYDYFDERQAALQDVANLIAPLVDVSPQT